MGLLKSREDETRQEQSVTEVLRGVPQVKINSFKNVAVINYTKCSPQRSNRKKIELTLHLVMRKSLMNLGRAVLVA